MKTKAAILVEQNHPLEIDEVEVPEPGYGQVLVRIHVSRICGSQIGEIDGVKGPDHYLPHLLGHEGGGIVEAIGPEVSHVKPGDHVTLHWMPGAGIQSRAPVYQRNGQTVSAGWVTTFNHHAIVSENRLTKIPPEIDFEIASLLADTIITGFGIINNDARLKIGESVVIIGCGGIGLGVVLAAKLAGAYPIIAVDLQPHKLDKAREYGATHTIDSNTCDFSQAVREITGDRGADCIIDGTGHPKVIEAAYQLTHAQGRTVLFGVMHHSESVSLHTLPLHFGKRLTGSKGGDSKPHEDIPRYLRMITNGLFNPTGFVSHRFKLDEVNDAIDLMREGQVIHAMIHME